MRWRMVLAAAAPLVACWSAGAPQAVGQTTTSGELTVTGEYTWYNHYGLDSIGPTEMAQLFHPGGLGPAGVHCDRATTTLVQNEVRLGFDSDGGPVTGSGTLEVACEGHPGCGVTSWVIEMTYTGEYSPDTPSMSGEATFGWPDGLITSWGIHNGREGCGEKIPYAGVRASGVYWAVDIAAEAPSLGYMEGVAGGDPLNRIALFDLHFAVDSVGAPSPEPGGLAADDIGVVGERNAVEVADDLATESDQAATDVDPAAPAAAPAAAGDDDSGGIGVRTIMLVVATAGIAGIVISSIWKLNMKRKPSEVGPGGGLRG